MTHIVEYILNLVPHTINARNAYELTPLAQLLANVPGMSRVSIYPYVIVIIIIY